MDILNLTLKDYKLFSPVTGELIYDARKNYLNENAKSLAGFWESDFSYYSSGPVINHHQLKYDWDSYMNSIEHTRFDPEGPDEPDIDNFLLSFDKDPGLICFSIKDADKPSTILWFALQMNGNPKLLE